MRSLACALLALLLVTTGARAQSTPEQVLGLSAPQNCPLSPSTAGWGTNCIATLSIWDRLFSSKLDSPTNNLAFTPNAVLQTNSALPSWLALSPSLPLIGGTSTGIAQGTRSGNTTNFATATGTLTNGHCVSIDANGNLIDAGGACSVGGGGGTVNAANRGQSAIYGVNGNTVSGANSAINAVAFGADPTGATDSTTAINSAISAAQGQNCQDIYFPPGTYKITGLTEGNGSTTQASSVCAPRLIGLGPDSPTAAYFSGYNAPSVTFKYAGSAGGTMLNIAGPISGWGVSNILFDCQSSAGKALQIVSAQWGRGSNIASQNCKTYGFYETTIATNSTGLVDVETMHNSFQDVSILIPAIANAGGIWVGSGTNTAAFNTAYETWDNVFISFNTTSLANFGLFVSSTDSDVFRHFHFTAGGSGAACVTLSYSDTSNGQFPAGVAFDHFDTSGCTTAWQNGGTPGGGATPNYVTSMTETNGAAWPIGVKNLVSMMGQNVGAVDLAGQSGAISVSPLSVSGTTSQTVLLSYYLTTTTTSGSQSYNVEFFWNDGTGQTQNFTSANASCSSLAPISGTVIAYDIPSNAIQYQTNIGGSLGACRYHLVVNANRLS